MTTKRTWKIGICRKFIGVTEMTMHKIGNGSNRILISVPGFAKLIDYARREHFDLIIMGLGNDGEGLKYLKDLHENFPRTKIWIFSKASDEIMKQARELGAEKTFSALKERKAIDQAIKLLS